MSFASFILQKEVGDQYHEAIDAAREEFAARNPEAMAIAAGGSFRPTDEGVGDGVGDGVRDGFRSGVSHGVIDLDVLGQRFQVTYPGGKIGPGDHGVGAEDAVATSIIAGGLALTPGLKLLILRYLVGSSGAPLADEVITFQELPQGGLHLAAFIKWALQPLTRRFGMDAAAFRERALELGAEPAPGDLGPRADVGVRFWLFPRAPVYYFLWAGDDEIPASASVMFDGSAPTYLSAESLSGVSLITNLLVSTSGSGSAR